MTKIQITKQKNHVSNFEFGYLELFDIWNLIIGYFSSCGVFSTISLGEDIFL